MHWPFRGRRSELAAVIELVDSGVRLITITGCAGSGKSALARHALHTLGFDDSAVLDAADADIVERAAATATAPRRGDQRPVVLLELPPADTEARARVAELLSAAPGLTLIVTSRSLLGLASERPVTVYPFPDPTLAADAELDEAWMEANPAAAMFLDRVRSVSRHFTPDHATLRSVIELSIRLRGLPLALHIAALHGGMLPIAAMRDELDQPLEFLRVGYAESSDPAESLSASIGLGISSLDADSVAVLAAIAQFPGGCSLRTLKFITKQTSTELRQELMPTVASLVNHGLLSARSFGRAGMTRFELPPFHREYLLESTSITAPLELTSALRSAIVTQCYEVSQLRGPAWDRAADLLGAEHENLLAFIRADSLDGHIDAASEIVDLVYRFWIHRGRLVESLELIQSLDRDGLDIVTRGRLALAAASMSALHTSYTSAYDDFGRAVACWRESGQRDRLAGALVAFAPAASEVDGWDAAKAALTEAIEIYAALGDDWLLARAQTQLGALAVEVPGQSDFARSNLEAASSTLQAFGDVGSASLPLEHLGRLLIEDGDFDQARLVLKRGLAEIRRINDQFHISAYLNLLGLCEIALGNPARAAERFLESLAIAVDLELKGRAVWCLEGLRDALGALNQPEAARLCVAYALELREQLGLNDWTEFCSPRRSSRSTRDDLSRPVSLALTGAAAWPPIPVLDLVGSAVGRSTDSPAPLDLSSPRPDGLTAREMEILGLIASGMTSRAIASHLVISIDTVGRHITNLYRKIGARGRADAAAYAIRVGLVTSEVDAGPAPFVTA
jgi:DNA-binding CsgD family transcriptional regulator